MFSAYTIKKLLPRLIIAAIAIQLSWWLSLEAIRLTNDVARGIQGLIYAPFGGSGAMTMSKIIASNPSVNQAAFNGTAIFGGLAAGTAFLVAGPSSLVGILALAVSAALGILIALFTLILRQAVIIGLVVTGPLAIAAWILPGTQKLWKIWWESFSKLLLMYPLILIIIAGGRVFAYIAANTTGINQFAQFAMIVLGVFGPLFLIPATLKVSGAAFGALTGAINNKGKGAFDRLRNVRSNEAKKTWADTRAGNRFKGNGAVSRNLSRGLGVATNVDKAGFNPRHMRSRMRTALATQSSTEAEKFAKENLDFAQISGDDAKLWAASHTNRAAIAAELEARDAGRFGGAENARARNDAVEQILRAQRGVSNHAFQRARVQAQASTGTGYQDADGNFDANMMLDDINNTYGNDRNGAGKALAGMRGALLQSGQVAGAAGFGTWAEQLEGRYGNTITAEAAHNTIMDDAIDSATPGQAIYGKPSSARAMGQAHTRRIQAIAQHIQAGDENPATRVNNVPGSGRAWNQDDLSAAMAGAAGIYDALSQASPGNASAFANVLMREQVGVPLTANDGSVLLQQGTIREYIQAQMDGNAEFVNRRRDLAQSTLAAAQQQLQQQQQPPGPGGLPQPPTGGPPGQPR